MLNDNNLNDHSIDRKSISSQLEYDKLLSLGIKSIQKYSGEQWTDFNLHDPGVTILECLCFALTDLSYRTGFDLEDILTKEDGYIDRDKNSFFTRKEILSTNPVIINDFRKLIIDRVPEIYNVWLEPIMSRNQMSFCNGLYKVIIQLNHKYVNAIEEIKNEIEKTRMLNMVLGKVKNCVNDTRNIGEDVEDYLILKPIEIKIYANVMVGAKEFPEEILAEIYSILYRTLNPGIHFYTESQLQQKGYSPEAINRGPQLHKGFLLDDDLYPRARFIDPADILKAISGINGVLIVQELSIVVDGKKYERELCPVDNEHFLFLDYTRNDPSINLINENFLIPVKYSLFSSILNTKLDDITRITDTPVEQTEINRQAKQDDQFRIKGTYHKLDEYISIQHLFPEIYKLKISLEELMNNTSPEKEFEQARVKQLKAFLMLFEQVIANYLAQLSNIDNIFSSRMSENELYTYFTQPVYEVPGAEKIIHAYYDGKRKNDQSAWNTFKNNKNNYYNKFIQRKSETDITFEKRKNRILEHILSRFNLVLHNYPIQLYKELYNWDKIEGRMTMGLIWKKNILGNILPLLKNRNQAYNYSQEREGRKMGGFLEKMHRLLFIGIDPKGIDQPGNEFLIRRLSPVMPRLNMVSSSTETVGKGHVSIPETFDITFQDKRLKIVKETDSFEPTPAGIETGAKTAASGELQFRQAGISFIKHGININNYQVIVDDRDKKTILLIFQTPGQGYWHIAGKFANFETAFRSRNEFIDYLRKISIDSEGFHLVEHILLRPDLQSPQFGFNIMDEQEHLLCTHNAWTNFEERDKNIAKLIGYAKLKGDQFQDDFESQFEGICKLAVVQSEHPDNTIRPSVLKYLYKDKKSELNKLYHRMGLNLVKMAEGSSYSYMKVKSLVKRTNGEGMPEDFFNFRATLVLPSWPARFQDNQFREFITRLFLDNCPVHLRLNFLWLNLKEMAAFENQYFDWLTAINKDKSSLQVSDLTDNLIAILYNGIS